MRLVHRRRLHVDRRHGHRLLPLGETTSIYDDPKGAIGRIWVFQNCNDWTTGDWACDWEAFPDVESAIDRLETTAKRIYNNMLKHYQEINAQGQKRFGGDQATYESLRQAAEFLATGQVSDALQELIDHERGYSGESMIIEIFETDIYP